MVNPYAYFDSLSISLRVQNRLGNVAAAEIYLFAYLSCILSLYRMRPASDWQYRFSFTNHGFPYSVELETATKTLVDTGDLVNDGPYLRATEDGHKDHEMLRHLYQNSEREPFIDGACSSLLALPVGVIRNALSQEAELKGAVSLTQSRMLLSDSWIDMLHDEFAALSCAIGIEIKDLMVPAVIWLTNLSQITETLSVNKGLT
jgi:hypothetical protein